MDPREDQKKQGGLIDQANNILSTAGTLRRGYHKGLAISTTLKKQSTKRGAVFLLSNPLGWVLLISLGIVFLILIVFLLFLAQPDPGSETTCETGICYYLDGPSQVANGEELCYQLTLIHDPTKTVTSTNNITLYDDYPETQLSFVAATGVMTRTADRVDWDLSLPGNQSTTKNDPLENCPDLATVVPAAGQRAFYFKVKFTPTITDTIIVNSIGVTIQ